MSRKKVANPYILIMKVGPYCGYSLNEIIKIKKKEEAKCGMFYWGYGGVFCRPNVINSFVSHTKLSNENPVVLFTTTSSVYQTTEKGRFTHFSTNNSRWQVLPKEVLLVGNNTKPHFAIVAKNLKKTNFTLNLSDYCTLVGMFPDKNKYLDTYFKYRVDKACGVYLPMNDKKEKNIQIEYSCELTTPHTVFIK